MHLRRLLREYKIRISMLLFEHDDSEEAQFRELIFNLSNDTHISDWLHSLTKNQIKGFYQDFSFYFLQRVSIKLMEIRQTIWHEAFEEIIAEKYDKPQDQ